jgi:hypothetical protein
MGQNLTGQTIASTYEDLVQISGSARNFLTDGTGSNITNLQVTASFATTASFALNAAGTNTGSLMVTGSATSNVLTFTKGDGSTFNLTVATGSAVTVNTGSVLVPASISNATTTYTKGDGSTFALTTNNVSNASTASIATSASYALTASFAENVTPINTGSFYLSSSVANATITFNQGDGTTEAVTVNNVSNASTASIATSASYAVSASQAQNAVTASFALSTITGTSATGSFTGSTWVFSHNLNKEYVIIDCYDSSNEEIIPQTVDLTSANQAIISFPVSVTGTAVASLGNGITTGISPTSVYSAGVVSGESSYTYKLDANAAIVYNIHVSQSGCYWIDATNLASGTGCSVNTYFYPELLTNIGDLSFLMVTAGTGSAAAVSLRTVVSASAGYAYYSSATTLGTTTVTVTRNATLPVKSFGGNNNNPSVMSLNPDGIFFGAGGINNTFASTNYQYKGNQGTPI